MKKNTDEAIVQVCSRQWELAFQEVQDSDPELARRILRHVRKFNPWLKKRDENERVVAETSAYLRRQRARHLGLRLQGEKAYWRHSGLMVIPVTICGIVPGRKEHVAVRVRLTDPTSVPWTEEQYQEAMAKNLALPEFIRVIKPDPISVGIRDNSRRVVHVSDLEEDFTGDGWVLQMDGPNAGTYINSEAAAPTVFATTRTIRSALEGASKWFPTVRIPRK